MFGFRFFLRVLSFSSSKGELSLIKRLEVLVVLYKGYKWLQKGAIAVPFKVLNRKKMSGDNVLF